MSMFATLAQKIKGKDLTIVFPEGNEPRILEAVARLSAEDLIHPILLGKAAEIQNVLSQEGINLGEVKMIDPDDYDQFDEMVDAFVERRKGKNTAEKAQKMLRDNAYFGTMLVYMGLADGMVCGAIYSTGATVRPALQIIKTRPGVKLTSGAFIMVPPTEDGEKLVFSDCAININPDAQQLAEIAVESAKTAEIFDIEPRVAMLSFSTKGSAVSDEVTKVAEATKIAQGLAPEYAIDGELQFDAAYVPSVGQQKAPDSKVAGKATVYVFPEIQSGNIGYKIAQRLGGYEAIGPILQGLNKPVSDLSRGCTAEDVYKIAIITANQALMK